MKPLFNQVQIKQLRRNAFDMSHEKKLSCNMGELVPIYLQEVIPGDKFRVNTEMLVRLAPMVAPMMHRVNIYTHYFFVPNRLLYKSWPDYITGGSDGLAAPSFPTLSIDDGTKALYGEGSLGDYLGIPKPPVAAITNPILINALPFRAYQLIYNEYYRDQTLTPIIGVTNTDTVAGGEATELPVIRLRSWEKDYFTSALPWTQRGASVNLPNNPTYKTISDVYRSTGASPSGTAAIQANASHQMLVDTSFTGRVENLTGIDISVINLRRALKLQEWLEKNATGGSRYIEQILAHFGVRVSDYRLQRPEYLGGGKAPVTVSEVVSMVKETTNPQGTMAGHGIGVGNTMGFKKYFEEHGFIIGIMSTMPRTAYQQGLPRLFTKADRFDYYWDEFAHIGEQAVLNKELYINTSTALNDGVFGYVPRYSEYKFNNSTVHGDFRSSLNFWHMGRIFAAAPALNAAFVQSDPTTRVFAVNDTSDHLWIQIYNQVKAIRSMPVFGTPML